MRTIPAENTALKLTDHPVSHFPDCGIRKVTGGAEDLFLSLLCSLPDQFPDLPADRISADGISGEVCLRYCPAGIPGNCLACRLLKIGNEIILNIRYALLRYRREIIGIQIPAFQDLILVPPGSRFIQKRIRGLVPAVL